MTRVPVWALVSSTGAPVLLIGGWTIAAARQRAAGKPFDSVVDTISALAAHGAADRWLMTTALTGVGTCHLLTALALRPAARAGRAVLAVGGVATWGVAAFPLPADDSGSVPHFVVASIAFGSLAVWPALAVRRRATSPPLTRPAVGIPVAIGLLGLVGWFAVEMANDTGHVGLAERAAAGAQSLWPLVAVVTARSAQSARSRRRIVTRERGVR